MEKVKTKMRVGFLGRGKLGMDVLVGLLANPALEIPVIVSCASSPEVKYSEQDFQALAEKHRIPFYKTNHINQETFIQILKSHNLDLAVAMLWLYVIEKRVIETARIGFVNCHGGLLAKYRGNACANWGILNKETKMGITVHFMRGGELDSGPIILQKEIPLNEKTTIGHFTACFDKIGAGMVLKSVEKIRKGHFKPILQNEDKASYCYPRLPRDGEIDWNRPAEDIYRLIRATGRPYPGAYSYFADVKDGNKLKKLTVFDGKLEQHPLKTYYAVPGHVIKLEGGKKWAVVCGDKKLIVLKEIEIDGTIKKPPEFFKSVRQRLGIDTAAIIFQMEQKIERIQQDVEKVKNNSGSLNKWVAKERHEPG